MEKKTKRIPGFDDIVFEVRNKEYGAYVLRKNYNRNIFISLLIGILIIVAAVITPYYSARVSESRKKRSERLVELKMENLDIPDNTVVPPPPPPPPHEEVVQQVKYVPPVVVDSVKPDESVKLMTADEAQLEVKNEKVVEIASEVKEEVQEKEAEPEILVRVEEMPMFPGGETELLKYIGEHTQYSEIAKENNVQGKVIVRFCVTATGGVDKVSVYKGVDPELDAEAVRVVKALPLFKPGRQGGIPVPVWYIVPINFQLK